MEIKSMISSKLIWYFVVNIFHRLINLTNFCIVLNFPKIFSGFYNSFYGKLKINVGLNHNYSSISYGIKYKYGSYGALTDIVLR